LRLRRLCRRVASVVRLHAQLCGARSAHTHSHCTFSHRDTYRLHSC
jgi:hypothetical protein